MRQLPLFMAMSILFFAGCAAGAAQAAHSCSSVVGNKPCIEKVEPPNWWTDLPSPMLLLYGRHLHSAHFRVEAAGASLAKAQSSENGHYAFLWLKTGQAREGTLKILAANESGETAISWKLNTRKPESVGFKGFSAADVMYLIMTDRFADGDTSNDPRPSQRDMPRGWHGGDFRGIKDHLDYLQQLGVTTVWTTPVYDNSGEPQAYHGYSTTDFYQVDPHFGTLADYAALAEALHRRGMKIVMDTVPNHMGPNNPWVNDPPAPNWFHGTKADHDVAEGNFRSLTDPHASWQQQRDVTQGWFANILPDLNQENPLVARYLIQNVIWWVEIANLDGLRYDTFPYVGRAFWQSLNGELHRLFPRVTTVGEVFNPDPTIVSWFAGGAAHQGIDTGLYTPFDFPMYFELRKVLTHLDPMTSLESILRKDWLYPHPQRLTVFVGNHDTMRFLSQPGVGIPDLKLAFGMLATLRGMPQIYSGDEIAMRGGDDPDNRRDFPGGFPGDQQDAFTAAGRTPEQAEVYGWAQNLLQFRNRHPVFGTGEEQDIFSDAHSFVYVRIPDERAGCPSGDRADMYLIAVNDSEAAQTIRVDLSNTVLKGCTQFNGELGVAEKLSATGASLSIPLEAKQIGIFAVQ